MPQSFLANILKFWHVLGNVTKLTNKYFLSSFPGNTGAQLFEVQIWNLRFDRVWALNHLGM